MMGDNPVILSKPMLSREPHIPDAFTALCREYRAKVREMLETDYTVLQTDMISLSAWEQTFLEEMLKRHTYTDKMMAKIDQIYETKM